MKTKEFLDEYYKLRKKLEKIELQHLKNIINLLELVRDSDGLDLDKLIYGFKGQLE